MPNSPISWSDGNIAVRAYDDTLQQARIQRFQSAVALFQALGCGWPER